MCCRSRLSLSNQGAADGMHGVLCSRCGDVQHAVDQDFISCCAVSSSKLEHKVGVLLTAALLLCCSSTEAAAKEAPANTAPHGEHHQHALLLNVFAKHAAVATQVWVCCWQVGVGTLCPSSASEHGCSNDNGSCSHQTIPYLLLNDAVNS